AGWAGSSDGIGGPRRPGRTPLTSIGPGMSRHAGVAISGPNNPEIVSQREHDSRFLTAIEADFGLDNLIVGFMIVPATCIIGGRGNSSRGFSYQNRVSCQEGCVENRHYWGSRFYWLASL
ncbi:MAG: hypothetical protein ACXVB2_25660, partial [Isosphaeraceae bacterium]